MRHIINTNYYLCGEHAHTHTPNPRMKVEIQLKQKGEEKNIFFSSHTLVMVAPTNCVYNSQTEIES